MPHANSDLFDSDQYLSPSTSAPKKSPSRNNLNGRRSSASLRGSSSLAHSMDEEAGNGRFSLAHELAAALMPEPSTGSKLLAEEFGIEYDEGAEGIDEEIHHHESDSRNHDVAPSFAEELGQGASFDGLPEPQQEPPEYDPVFASPSKPKKPQRPEQDPMEVLAQDLESTDNFLSHLRHIDAEPGSSGSQQSALEKIASDVIRRINDTARDREGQVRELLEYEREFRKISAEVGGNEVLGQLEVLAGMKEVLEDEEPVDSRSNAHLDIVEEEDSKDHSHDWNSDLHNHLHDEDDDGTDAEPTPIKDTFDPPPPLKGPLTPASTIPQLAHFRKTTTSLVTSLSILSEHAQVNGAATTEAGRKIRALKNKLGTWRTDWDSAERSRIKIERWEAGIIDTTDSLDPSPIHTPSGARRADGRQVVQEHLQAFERALADAGMKTQAIMAS
ncbi:hypothetical protein VNI00_002834 [Paramarasmius palmivorus]|uniref:Uncharacterized protein n=1 Tax=Paramarasmius palmivorus TaxID=297713 RepID=A0AAW0DVD3_9AGAR